MCYRISSVTAVRNRAFGLILVDVSRVNLARRDCDSLRAGVNIQGHSSGQNINIVSGS